METKQDTIGKRLRDLRHSRRMTLVQVMNATEPRVHYASLWRYEHGVNDPPITALKALARLYNTTIGALTKDL